MGKIILFLFLSLLNRPIAYTQTVIRLYEGKAPGSTNWTRDEVVKTDTVSNSRVAYKIVTPTLTTFLPNASQATGTAILIFPGGGLTSLELDREGVEVTKWLAAKGVAAFVLKYRLIQADVPDGTSRKAISSEQDSVSALTQALADGQKAVEYLRQHAAGFRLQADRIGILGFATGSTLAASLAYDSTATNRPNFVALIHPHVGALATREVPMNAPSLLMVAATGDSRQEAVQIAQLYSNWFKSGRSVELHSYAANERNADNSKSIAFTDECAGRLVSWLKMQDYLSKPAPPVPRPTTIHRDSIRKTERLLVESTGPVKKEMASIRAVNQERKSSASPRSNEAIVLRKKLPVSSTQTDLVRVSGMVRDSATGQPLAGAAIVIDYRKALTGTSTNAQGRYSIDLPAGEHILVARLVGYTPVRKVLNVMADPVIMNVEMVSVASQLEEVVVTTTGFDRTVRQPVLGANQLNISTLKKLPAALGEVDLLRGLQMLPGVTSVGGTSNGVNIRGAPLTRI